MYLTLCINAENRDEGVKNHSEGTQQKHVFTPRRSDQCVTRRRNLQFLIIDNHVKNRKYGNFVSISSLAGECAAQKIKNFCSSSLWTCLHHMVILRSQNKITDFFMILAWASPFKTIKYMWFNQPMIYG